jgi:cytochrome c-type biogenesis protein CcmH
MTTMHLATAETQRAGWRRVLITAIIAFGLLGTAVSYAIDPTELPDPALQKRYLALTHELRCMQCQNETIADSPVSLAADLRREVRDMLVAGKSDDDVRNFMVARYGDFILFRPRFTARTGWVWLAPGVLLLVGLYVFQRILRHRATLVGEDNEPLEEDLRS